MDKLKFKIATPERVVYEAKIDKLSCPTQMGEITILPGHIPLVASLVPGELKITEDGVEKYLVLSGGFVEVKSGREIVILADAAEHAEEIDEQRAEEARKRAKKIMAQEFRDDVKFAEASSLLERSLARLRVARRRKHGGASLKISSEK